MKNIFGTINIDFDTDKDITQDQFDKFKHKFENQLMDNFEMMIYELANEFNFEADSIHPALLDGLNMDDVD